MASLTGVSKFFATANETGTLSLTSTTSGGAGTLPVTGLSSYYSNGDIVGLAVEPGTASQQLVFGEVSGNSLINCHWTEGSNVSHAGGSSIKDLKSATDQAAMTKGILVEHAQDGTHADITPDSVTTGAVAGTTGAYSGALTAAGVTSTNTTNKFKDESGNSVDADPVRRNEGFQGQDYVAMGLVSTTSAGLTAAISAGTYYISGKRYTYAGGTKLLTASKDSYLDINTSGTITEVTATIGAASPALTANSIRIAKVLTGASSITSHNTGTAITTAFDSLGNRIRRTDPREKILGYSEITTDFTTASATFVQVTGVTATVIVPSWAVAVRVRAHCGRAENSTAGAANTYISVWDGVVASGTEICEGNTQTTNSNHGHSVTAERVISPTGSKTYNMGCKSSAGTAALKGTITEVILTVEVV